MMGKTFVSEEEAVRIAIQTGKFLYFDACPCCYSKDIKVSMSGRWNGWEIEVKCNRCGSRGGARIDGFGGSTASKEWQDRNTISGTFPEPQKKKRKGKK